MSLNNKQRNKLTQDMIKDLQSVGAEVEMLTSEEQLCGQVIVYHCTRPELKALAKQLNMPEEMLTAPIYHSIPFELIKHICPKFVAVINPLKDESRLCLYQEHIVGEMTHEGIKPLTSVSVH